MEAMLAIVVLAVLFVGWLLTAPRRATVANGCAGGPSRSTGGAS